MVKIGNVKNGRLSFDSSTSFVDEEIAHKSGFILKAGQIVIGMTGAYVGQVAKVFDSDGPVVLNQRVGLVSWNASVIHPDYLFAVMRSDSFLHAVESRAHGSAQPNISPTQLESIPIPLPTMEEQQKISKQFAYIEARISSNKKIVETSLALGNELYKVLAASCSNISVKNIANIVLGGTPSKATPAYWQSREVPWLNSGAANQDVIVNPTDYISFEGLRNSSAKLMPAGATVVAITGSTLGQTSYLGLDTAGNQSLIGIWGDEPEKNPWLHFAIRNSIEDLLRKATGAAQQHVNKNDVEAWQIPYPDTTSLKKWSSDVQPLLDLAVSRSRESFQLDNVRNILFQELISRRVVIKGLPS